MGRDKQGDRLRDCIFVNGILIAVAEAAVNQLSIDLPPTISNQKEEKVSHMQTTAKTKIVGTSYDTHTICSFSQDVS